jgi:hypothetical protein
MAFGVSGGKRLREAARDQKKKDKAERIQRNRAQRAQGSGHSSELYVAAEKLPEVKLEDINISGVAPRGPKGSYGPTKLFVGGLSWDTGDEQLREAFLRFGPLQEATIVTDRASGRSRGFGFVTFEKPIDAAAALKQMNGADLDGRTLRVNAADRG